MLKSLHYCEQYTQFLYDSSRDQSKSMHTFHQFFFSKFTPPKLISFFTKKLNRSHSLECPCQKDIIQQAKSFPSIQNANNFFAVQLNFFDFSANPININLILFTLEKLFVIQT